MGEGKISTIEILVIVWLLVLGAWLLFQKENASQSNHSEERSLWD
jgi:L-asparagine transporter-like permease